MHNKKNFHQMHILDCLKTLCKPFYKWNKVFVIIDHPDYSYCRAIRKRIMTIIKKRHSGHFQPSITAECLDEFVISNFIHGILKADELQPIEKHLAKCDLCLARTWAILKGKHKLYNKLTYPEIDKTSKIFLNHLAFFGVQTYMKFIVGFIFLIIILFIFILLQKYKYQKSITMKNFQRLRSEPIASIEIPSFKWSQDKNQLLFRWKAIDDVHYYTFQIWEVSSGELIFEQKTTSNSLEIPIENYFHPENRYLWKVEAYAYQRLLYDFPPMTFYLDSLALK